MNDTTTLAARGTTAFLGQSVLTGLTRVIVLMILTRLLLQTEMGQVAILGIVYGIMQFLGAMGLNHAAPLFITRAERDGDIAQIRGLLQRSLRIIVSLSILLVIFLSVISPLFLVSGLFTVETFSLLLITAPLSSVEVFLDSFLMGRYLVRQLVLGRVCFELIRMGSVIMFVHIGLGVTGVILGWALSELAAVIMYLRQSLSGLEIAATHVNMRPVIAFALPSLIFQIVDVTIQNTDRVILLYRAGLASLGVYDVMLGLLFMMSFVSLAVSTSLYPILTRIGQDTTSVESLEAKSTATTILLRYLLFLLLPGSVIVTVNSGPVLSIILGPAYAQFPGATLSFALLVIFYAVWGMTYALHTVLRAMGESRFFWSVGLFVIVVEIIGCWYLTSLYGLFGAALIRCLYITILAVTALTRLRQLGITVRREILGSLVRTTVVSVVAGLLVYLSAPSTIISLLLTALFAVSLIILLLILGREFQPFDFKVVRSVIPKRLHGIVDQVERLAVR